MPALTAIGRAIAEALRNPIVREVIAVVVTAAAQYVIRRMKRRPTAP